ncbi:MAG: aminoacyl-tRNA hydrolase [Candidatus Omnitrophica bacterium]|nr:aminoacyl-tRNA hydrolase [Candidatus Omnitrophota bacterium]
MVILGLGNPGKKYYNNRHNIGAKVAEEILKRANSVIRRWRQKYFFASSIEIFSKALIVAVPRTFMNESGKAAASICTRFNIKPEELFLIYDDINLEIGMLRIRKKGSSGGHKGVQSIIDALGTENIPRLRMGIGMPQQGQDLVEYVLSDFQKEEKETVQKMIMEAVSAIEILLNEGIEKAMAQVNSKGRKI